jgi:hypothetical protein
VEAIDCVEEGGEKGHKNYEKGEVIYWHFISGQGGQMKGM